MVVVPHLFHGAYLALDGVETCEGGHGEQGVGAFFYRRVEQGNGGYIASLQFLWIYMYEGPLQQMSIDEAAVPFFRVKL